MQKKSLIPSLHLWDHSHPLPPHRLLTASKSCVNTGFLSCSYLLSMNVPSLSCSWGRTRAARRAACLFVTFTEAAGRLPVWQHGLQHLAAEELIKDPLRTTSGNLLVPAAVIQSPTNWLCKSMNSIKEPYN